VGVRSALPSPGLAIFRADPCTQNVDYDEVFLGLFDAPTPHGRAWSGLVATSYGSLTLYDLLALRTMGAPMCRIGSAALASFTSYPIAHGVGAVALVAPVIRYRIYSYHGLGVFGRGEYQLSDRPHILVWQSDALGLACLARPMPSA